MVFCLVIMPPKILFEFFTHGLIFLLPPKTYCHWSFPFLVGMNILNKAFSSLRHEIIPSFLRLFIPLLHSSQKNWILEKDESQKLLSQGVETLWAERRLHTNIDSWERRQLLSQPYTVCLGHNWGWTHPTCSPCCAVVGQHRASSLQPRSTLLFTCACQGEGSTSGCERLEALQVLGGRGRASPHQSQGLPCPTPPACIPALQQLPIPGMPEATLHTHLWSP